MLGGEGRVMRAMSGVGMGGERYEGYDFCLEGICGPRLVLGEGGKGY